MLGGAACSTSTATSTTITTTTAPVTTTTTTTLAPTTTTSTTTSTTTTLPDDDTPPEIDLTAETCEDFDRWWVETNRFIEWLGTHPTDDLDVLSMLYHPDGPEIEQKAGLYRDYREQDIRLFNAGLGDALAIGCPEELIADGWLIMIFRSAQTAAAQYVDPDGVPLRELPGWSSHEWDAKLKLTSEGEWLIWDFE